jgi:hypothetical protein
VYWLYLNKAWWYTDIDSFYYQTTSVAYLNHFNSCSASFSLSIFFVSASIIYVALDRSDYALINK